MPRIVSLIASATEIVHLLGETGQQVGRSHECDWPEAVTSLPVCTRPRIDVNADSREIDRQVRESAGTALSIYDVFDDVLERLQPTHILTQTQCEVCAVSLRDVERSVAQRLASRPRIVPLAAMCLADIWDDVRRVAASLDIVARGEAAITGAQARLRAVSQKPGGRPRPRVACIEWLEPLMAAGNWTPELIDIAGGVNLFGEAGRHSPWMTWEELIAAGPDLILAAPCGFDLARTAAEMHWLTDRPGWSQLRAVRQGKVYIADGNRYFNRPGPSVVETAEILAEVFHGTGAHFAGVAWKQWISV